MSKMFKFLFRLWYGGGWKSGGLGIGLVLGLDIGMAVGMDHEGVVNLFSGCCLDIFS